MKHFQLISLGMFVSFATIAHGQWSTNPVQNTIVTIASGYQQDPLGVSDGSRGAIFAWQDYRNSLSADIYAQRLDANGMAQWTSNGIALCTAGGDQRLGHLISDGAGSAIAVWSDSRTGARGIYVQKVNASGVVAWTPDGVALCTGSWVQANPRLVSDGAGGAIAAWYDERGPTWTRIYARRIGVNGAVLWTANGVALATATGNQIHPSIISDGAGGAIIVFSQTNWAIVAQRINADGIIQWNANGVAVCTSTAALYSPRLVSDGRGGAIIIWQDMRTGVGSIRAQRINANGVVQWASGGVEVCTTARSQGQHQIASDGAGGAIITWKETQPDGSGDIYAQRVDSTGSLLWPATGVAVCTNSSSQTDPQLVSDGAGGAVISWGDYRNFNATGSDIYAQRINAGGSLLWTADGVALSIAAADQALPTVMTDGLSGAIVAWIDHRPGTAPPDIYAQQINANGQLGIITSVDHSQGMPAVFMLDQNYPNPFNPVTTIQFSIPQKSNVILKVYDILGNEVATLVNEEKDRGVYSVKFDASHLTSGMYLYRLKAGSFIETKKMILIK